MAANVNSTNAVSDGSPPNHLTQDTLQDNATQGSRLDISVLPHQTYPSAAEQTSALHEGLPMDAIVVGRLNKLLDAIETSRANRKSLRAELKIAKRRWKTLRKAYRRSRAVYDDAVNPFGSLQDTAHTRVDTNLSTLREASDRDRQAFEAYSGQIRIFQDAIRTTQRALNRSQTEFEEVAVRRMPEDEPSRTSTDAQTETTNAPQSHHTPASSTQGDQPLLDKYLKRAADVGIFGERLADCNYEYWTAVSQREMRQDQDEELSETDEDFERYWQSEKEGITRDLDEAIREADNLLAACRKEGLVLEDSVPDQGDTDFTEPPVAGGDYQIGGSRSLEATVTKLPQALFDDVEDVRADPSDDDSMLQNKPRIEARVGSWMEEVQAEGSGIE
jgi:hypothetical protein